MSEVIICPRCGSDCDTCTGACTDQERHAICLYCMYVIYPDSGRMEYIPEVPDD